MRRFAVVITMFIIALFGCTHNCVTQIPGEEYPATAILLSDFSMTIIGYYGTQDLSVPNDFDKRQFFALLEKIYPDPSHVSFVQSNYKVSVRPLAGGYSVMLCDPQTNRKIMEDLSCHLDRVEIQSWQSNVDNQCVFESNWKQYCE